MFHRDTGASKVAFAACAERLRERSFAIFDVQVLTTHLEMLGCVEIPRVEYLARVTGAIQCAARFD
jgi:leucyl/phenylalanyl-tRNA--protein transferase